MTGFWHIDAGQIFIGICLFAIALGLVAIASAVDEFRDEVNTARRQAEAWLRQPRDNNDRPGHDLGYADGSLSPAWRPTDPLG